MRTGSRVVSQSLGSVTSIIFWLCVGRYGWLILLLFSAAAAVVVFAVANFFFRGGGGWWWWQLLVVKMEGEEINLASKVGLTRLSEGWTRRLVWNPRVRLPRFWLHRTECSSVIAI